MMLSKIGSAPVKNLAICFMIFMICFMYVGYVHAEVVPNSISVYIDTKESGLAYF